MDTGEKSILQLTDSEKIILGNWQKLRNDEEFCDLTLISSDGVKIKAHKVILASLSSGFETMLRNEDHRQHALLYLRGVTYSQIVYLLDFIYNGQVSVNRDELEDFLNLANDLKIKGLHEETKENVEERRTNSKFPLESENLPDNKRKRIKNSMENESIETDSDSKEASPDHNQHVIKAINNTEIKEEIAPFETDFKMKTEMLIKSCDRCSYQTNRKTHLNAHVKSMHEGVRYPCDSCEYRAKSKSALKQHVRAVHEGVKYDCKECDYQAGYKSYLTEHTGRVHDPKVYSCDECEASITGKYKFDQHMKSKHKDLDLSFWGSKL